MKFTCEKPALLSSIVTAARAASAKSAVPALEGLLIEAGEDKVKISGYDLKTGIVAEFPADVVEAGAIVLSARLFGEIVRKMPDDYITISVSGGYMAKIECRVSEFEILGTPAADYPELPSVDYQNATTIPQKTLRAMIAQTIFAVSDNEARPIHTGALFEVEENQLTVVAVDGFRLAVRRETLSESSPAGYSFVVPGGALTEVERIALDEEEDATITVGSKHILFTIGNILLISRRLEGEFLNYKNSIPKTSDFTFEADRRQLVDAVERVSLIISDKLKSPVRCTFGDNQVHLLTVTALGKASDACEVKGNGDGLEIGFNNKYLLDALKAAPAEALTISLTSGVLPCIITPADGTDAFLYMILPVRLKANES